MNSALDHPSDDDTHRAYTDEPQSAYLRPSLEDDLLDAQLRKLLYPRPCDPEIRVGISQDVEVRSLRELIQANPFRLCL